MSTVNLAPLRRPRPAVVRAAALAALAAATCLSSACSEDSGDQSTRETVMVTTTVPSSASGSTAATSSSPASSSTSSAAPAAAVESASAPAGGCGAVGITAAPGADSPHCLDKQIASCGTSGLHQTGTTFFTDGTSGWTQACASQMAAAAPPQPTAPAAHAAPTVQQDTQPTMDQQARNQQVADDYWATHPKPTYDPDSADGYGPHQQLPPACLRLKGVNC